MRSIEQSVKALSGDEISRMVEVLKQVYDPPACAGIRFMAVQRDPLSYYNEAMEYLGLQKLQDIPDFVMQILDEGTPGQFRNTVLSLQLKSDYQAALGPFQGDPVFGLHRYDSQNGVLPEETTPFLDSPEFVREFARDNNLCSVFEKWVGLDSSLDGGVKSARKNLLARYCTILIQKDDPAYPASKVREDYFQAAVHGADLKMPTWEDTMDVAIARRFSLLEKLLP